MPELVFCEQRRLPAHALLNYPYCRLAGAAAQPPGGHIIAHRILIFAFPAASGTSAHKRPLGLQ